jgi:hypothetical protein
MRNSVSLLGVIMLFSVVAFAQRSDEGEHDDSVAVSTVDAEALELLREMTDFVASEQLFRFNTETAIEAVLTSGQKLQFIHLVALTVQRPNRLRADRLGELVGQSFYYDGQSLTINAPGTHFYATEPAPATIDGMLDFARDELMLAAPASDIIYSNAWERLSTGLTSGFVVGTALINGVLCDHVAFRNEVIDWQVWIQQGDQPLPRKLVITSKLLSQSPQFTVLMSDWENDFEVSESDFVFVPPEGATRIDFMSATNSSTR